MDEREKLIELAKLDEFMEFDENGKLKEPSDDAPPEVKKAFAEYKKTFYTEDGLRKYVD